MKECLLCSNKKIIFSHKINHYLYYLCNKCQTLFLNSKASEMAITHYYKTTFEYPAGISNKIKIIKRGKIILKNLKKINPNGKTLLDIGCGYGYFLDEAKRSGLQVEGIEPSKRLAVQLFKRLNSKVANLSFEEYFKKNKKKIEFDFISMIHVIEHVRDPKKWIEMALSLLNKNGVLYIETPNLRSHLYNFEKENYTFLTPPDHLWIFSKKSFEVMIKKISHLEIQKTSTYSYPEHFMGIIKNKFMNKEQKLLPGNKKNRFKNRSLISQNKFLKNIKYAFFDQLFAPIFIPLLNIGGYGSILELYIKKK